MYRETLRMSVLSGILRIQDYCCANPHVDPVAAADLLRRGTAMDAGFDYATAIQVISVLEIQQSIDASPVESLQSIIAATIQRFRPPWISAIPYGRSQLLRLLSRDEQQCFASARLLDANPTDQILAWWDALSAQFRAEVAKDKNDTGRRGERLSLQYERQRLEAAGCTDVVPRLVSIDDNSLGYDIASFATDADRSPRFIEVKASYSSPPQFIITHNEWQAATRLQLRFCFHIWDLTTVRMAEFAAEAIASHIPIDQGLGVWQQVRVSMNPAFWEVHSKGLLSLT